MYKRILVAIDGSDTSSAGLREACRLAKDQGSHLRLIHVVDEILGASPPIFGSAYDAIIAGLRKAGSSILARAESLAEKEGLTAEIQLVEAMGRPAGECVIDAAKKWPADLIVCGTHGRRGLRRIVMGSDAEYVVRRAPVPILLIRQDGR
jgi:nucleotide-binding universal stress UspA family protein